MKQPLKKIGGKYRLNFGGIAGRWPNKPVTILTVNPTPHYVTTAMYSVETEDGHRYIALDHELLDL